MDLHGMVSGVIASINPHVFVTFRASDGYSNVSGKRTAKYKDDVTAEAQIQPMQYRDLQQTEGLQLSGTRRKIYLYGTANATVRVTEKGGDIIIDTDGNVWLTALVLEQWPDWCAVAVTLQNGS